MIDVPVYMVQDKRTRRWASWRDWIEDSSNGGSVWYNLSEAERYVSCINAGTDVHGIEATVVHLRVTDGRVSHS